MAKKKKPETDADGDVEQTSTESSTEETQSDIAKDLVDDADQSAEPYVLDAEVLEQDAAVEDAEGEIADPDAEVVDAIDEVVEPEQEAEREESDPDPVETPELPVRPDPEPVVIREGGFVPMVLGGLAAAAIGFGVAKYVLPEPTNDTTALTEIQNELESQSSVASDLTGRVEALESGGDLSELEEGVSSNVAAIAALADRLAGLETQLDRIESRPVSEGASSATLDAYESELSELRSAIDAMTENAALLEENAQAAAQATLQRAALTRIQTALDAGVGFESAVTDLEGLGVTVPDPLKQSASTGVPSPTALEEAFPSAARAALEASRDVSGGSDGGGFSSFLKTQLGARSLEPREGSDPDAILSRAEAAARDGRFTDALAEIEALPEEGRAKLSDWSASVTKRLDAVAAAQDLSDQLN